jgi:hypothetical protein
MILYYDSISVKMLELEPCLTDQAAMRCARSPLCKVDRDFDLTGRVFESRLLSYIIYIKI